MYLTYTTLDIKLSKTTIQILKIESKKRGIRLKHLIGKYK